MEEAFRACADVLGWQLKDAKDHAFDVHFPAPGVLFDLSQAMSRGELVASITA